MNSFRRFSATDKNGMDFDFFQFIGDAIGLDVGPPPALKGKA